MYGDNEPHPSRTRKIVQIEAVPEHIEPQHLGLGYTGRATSVSRAALYALCDDNTLWVLVWANRECHWDRLPDIPQS
jgi:hypothetical protein